MEEKRNNERSGNYIFFLSIQERIIYKSAEQRPKDGTHNWAPYPVLTNDILKE